MSNVAQNTQRLAFRDTPFGHFVADFISNPIAMIGLVGFLLVAFVAIFAPWIAPQNPYDLMQLDFMDGNLEPGSQSAIGMTFHLGSDDQGRDILSGIMYGLRTSLTIGAASAFIALFIGAAIGLISAWFGGRTDTIIMRIVEVQMSFPAVLIALVLLAVLGQGTEKSCLPWWRCNGRITPAPFAAWPWWKNTGNTSMPHAAYAIPRHGSFLATFCPTACRHSSSS